MERRLCPLQQYHLTSLRRRFIVFFVRVASWKQWKRVRYNLIERHSISWESHFHVISDIRFPTLPKWFTTPLRAHAKRTEMIHLPDGSSQPSSPTPSSSKDLAHDHALLESLYYSVFESRFVNIRPTGTSFFIFQRMTMT